MLQRRGKMVLGIAVVLLLGALAHGFFWYLPRERTATPDPADLPGALLAGAAYDAVFWVPYPHQNLGVLAEGVGDPQGWLAAAARLSGAPGPRWSSFGPFVAPPAHEMAVAVDESGERGMVAARVYPTQALVARLAGKLAGNPWLAGGRVEDEDGVLEIRWSGTLWTVRRGPATERAALGPLPTGPVLAAARLRRPQGLLPAGVYGLRRLSSGGLELATVGATGSDQSPGFSPPGAVLALLNGPSGPLGDAAGVIIIFDRETGRRVSLPAAALLVRAPEESPPGGEEEDGEDGLGEAPGTAPAEDRDDLRLRLPHERLPSLVRGRLRRGRAAGLAILASDRTAVKEAEALAPEVQRALSDPRVEVALWLAPGPALGWVRRAADALEEVPLLPRREVQRWKDWRTVLQPLGKRSEVTLVRSREPQELRLVLGPVTTAD